MHIKKIIIDGFKSYGNRTEIGPFDSQFNAITGLNGTGKSNILDSICFVLGISNLSNVRASTLQDLIYKSGQAGVTKATVVIYFDNSDKKSSPLNYEQYDEITVSRQIQLGGKNKYIINGVTVQNKRVIDFFISIQLNVNNPNFLIMQGRITKVLNMKPIEILSLIEEAAGTRSYETKKEIANKTVDKKCPKLQEMSALIDDEVAPRLEKLRSDKVLFMDYQKLQRDLEANTRLYVAYRYLTHKKNLENLVKDNAKIEDDIANFHQKIKSNETENENIDQKVIDMQEHSSEANSELKKLDAEIKEHTMKEVSLNAQHKSVLASIKREQESKDLIQKSLKIDQDHLKKKEELMSKSDQIFQELKEADEMDSKALGIAERRWMAISAGLSADEEGNAVAVQDQLSKAQETVISSQSSCQRYEMEMSHFQSKLSELEKATCNADTKYNEDKNTFMRLQKELDCLNAKMKNMNYSDEAFKQLTQDQKDAAQAFRSAKYALDNVRAGSERFSFHYKDPEPNFDRRRVRGMFCRLFKPINACYSMALEQSAGGQLYNIVVDTAETGKKLINNGQLRNRITIIPLNKITGYRIDKKMEDLAKNIGGPGKVHAAMNVIRYSEVDEPAMIHIFGGLFICDDLDTARKVAFHPNIKRKCITLAGDLVNPAGTLSGGALAKNKSALKILHDIEDKEYELKCRQEEVEEINKRIADMKDASEESGLLKHQINMKKLEIQTVQRHLEQTDFYQHQEDMKKLRKDIASHINLLQEAKDTYEKAKKAVTELTAKVKDSKGSREKDLKKAQQDLELARKKAENSKKKWQEREQEFFCMTIEISELKKHINEYVENMKKSDELMKEFDDERQKLEIERQNIQEQSKQLELLMKEKKNNLIRKNSEVQKLLSQKESHEKENEEIKLQIKKAEQNLKKKNAEMEDDKTKKNQLLNEYPWIKDEESTFGVPGSTYDFKTMNMKDLSKNINTMRENKKTMERNLNPKAMSMLPAEESNFSNAVERKHIVEEDGTWLKGTLSKLDIVKKQTIEAAYKHINKDFGSIFSTLLPGAYAKLQPVQGRPLTDGLEVKVSFNNVWKESLAELSGGQRSLVALSLILAMLLYKPAPLYILDEVDAALDLSHTQNIGQMLKNHFKDSQFIIVSLKEGMFNNATVLFQTRFINGMSTVIRTTHDSKKRTIEQDKSDEVHASKQKK